MKAFINIFKGFQKTIQVKRLIIFLFLINFVFSLILAVPMYHSLKNSFGDGSVGDKMLESFDIIWWGEFRHQNDGLADTFTPGIIGGGALLINLENLITFRFLRLPPVLLIFGLIYILFHTFLSGGVLTVLNREKPFFSLKSFFSGAGDLFLPFLAYVFMFWIVLFFFIGSLNRWFSQILTRISQNASSEIFPFIMELLFSAVILFLILFFHMIFDYARIRTAQVNKKPFLKNLFTAGKFVLKHPGSTLGVYYFIVFAGILISLAYILLSSLIHQQNFAWILVGFILQQLFILGLIWVRCWLYAGELELHRYI